MEHIFLTGPVQVGKSTAINRFLAVRSPRVGGFRTVAGPWENGGSDVCLVRADGTETPCAANRVLRRTLRNGRRSFQVFPEVFNRRGVELLRDTEGRELILMDELGTRESGAPAFRQAVLDTLNGRIPVLGVVQARECAFLEEVRRHPNVKLVPVTLENREEVLRYLLNTL